MGLQKAYGGGKAGGAGQLEIIGTDPATGEPIYANVAGKNKDARTASREIIAREMMKKGLEGDEAYQKARAELYSGNPLSAKRQSELVKTMRSRVDAWGNNLGISQRDAFYAAFGDKEQEAKDAAAALDKSGTLDALGAGVQMGWNSLLGMGRQVLNIFNPEERLRIGRETAEANRRIQEENPDLRETMLRQQEAAAQGKELGFWEASEGNRWDNIAAQAANMATSFAPAIAGSVMTGGLAGPALLGGATGAAFNAESMAERVAQDPNLTEEQKVEALGGTAAALNAGAGGLIGAVMPGGLANKSLQGFGRGAVASAMRAAEAAGRPLRPALMQGAGGALRRVGVNAAARAAAPRTVGRLFTDLAANTGENAGLMAANRLAENITYQAATGQGTPYLEGVGDAAIMGATMGVPFGLGRYIHRIKAPKAPATETGTATENSTGGTSAKANEGAAAMFGSKHAEDAARRLYEPNAKEFSEDFSKLTDSAKMSADPKNAARRFGGLTNEEIVQLRQDEGFKAFYGELHEVMKQDTPEAIEKQNQLIAEYIKGRGAGALKELDAMRMSALRDRVIAKHIGEGRNQMRRFAPEDAESWNAVERMNLVKRLQEWNATENINERISKYFPEEKGGGRIAGILGKPKPGRAEEPAPASSGEGGNVAKDTPAADGTLATAVPKQAGNGAPATESGGTGGAAQQGVGQNEAATAAPVQPRGFLGQLYARANAARTGAGSKQAGNGAGGNAGEAGRGAGGGSDGAQAGRGEQPAGAARISQYSDDLGGHTYTDVDLGFIQLRKENKPNAKWMFKEADRNFYPYVGPQNLNKWLKAVAGDKNYKTTAFPKDVNERINNDINNIFIDNAVRAKSPDGSYDSTYLSQEDIGYAFGLKKAPADWGGVPPAVAELAKEYRDAMLLQGKKLSKLTNEDIQDFLRIKNNVNNAEQTLKTDAIFCGG